MRMVFFIVTIRAVDNDSIQKKTEKVDNFQNYYLSKFINPNAESCLYHPGPPYFHDAYKIWKCCGNKSTDFGCIFINQIYKPNINLLNSTWLSYKGCTRGPHNPEKPIEEEQQNPKLAQCGQQQIRPENVRKL